MTCDNGASDIFIPFAVPECRIPLQDQVLPFVVAELTKLPKKCLVRRATIDGEPLGWFGRVKHRNALDDWQPGFSLGEYRLGKAHCGRGRRPRDELPPSHVPLPPWTTPVGADAVPSYYQRRLAKIFG